MPDIPFRQVVAPAAVRKRVNMSTGVISNQNIPSTPILELRRWNTQTTKVGSDGWRKPTTLNAYRFEVTLFPQDFYARLSIGSTVYHYTAPRSPNPVPFFRYGTIGSGTVYKPSLHATTAARSVTQAKSKANRQTINFGTTFAEGAKSIDTLLGLIMAAAKIITAMKKHLKRYVNPDAYSIERYWIRARQAAKNAKPWKVGTSIIDSAASLWLTFYYGLLPIYRDMHATSELLRKGLDMRSALHVTSRVTEEYPMPFRAGSPGDIVTGNWFCGAFTRLDYRVSNQSLAALGQVGLLNPLGILWELVPFSFVVDWFLPVGTWLEALTSSVGLTFKGGSTTSRNWGLARVQMALTASDGTYLSGDKPSLTYRGVCVERTVWGFDPIALLYVKSPFTNSSRVASAAALVSQVRKH